LSKFWEKSEIGRVLLGCKQNCLQHLRVSAKITTTRFPLFQAFTVKPAVGKAAQWLRSEILMIFVFFTSLIGLPRAEKNGF
jgi:hypothetical protein